MFNTSGPEESSEARFHDDVKQTGESEESDDGDLFLQPSPIYKRHCYSPELGTSPCSRVPTRVLSHKFPPVLQAVMRKNYGGLRVSVASHPSHASHY